MVFEIKAILGKKSDWISIWFSIIIIPLNKFEQTLQNRKLDDLKVIEKRNLVPPYILIFSNFITLNIYLQLR